MLDPTEFANNYQGLTLCRNRASAQHEATNGYYRGARWAYGYRGDQWATGSALDLLLADYRVMEQDR